MKKKSKIETIGFADYSLEVAQKEVHKHLSADMLAYDITIKKLLSDYKKEAVKPTSLVGFTPEKPSHLALSLGLDQFSSIGCRIDEG